MKLKDYIVKTNTVTPAYEYYFCEHTGLLDPNHEDHDFINVAQLCRFSI